MTGDQPCSAIRPIQHNVRATIEAQFPELWPAVEVALSTSATLLLADNVNPVAVILVGPPSAGKTTVAMMLEGATVNGQLLCYRSDKFTPASFVSQSAKVTQDELKNVDLLPRIKHKVLVTPELAPIFRGRPDELSERFSTITRVLDGQGFQTDSGTHGQRGYTGDYLFAWLGCTTPFSDATWKVMAQLGSRLFFLLMDGVAEPSVDDLVRAIQQPVPYGERVKVCRQAVHEGLAQLFTENGGVRGVTWNAQHDPVAVLEVIAQSASLLALMRTPFEAEDMPPSIESPHRANSVLYNLARGHALVCGRRVLTLDDLPTIVQVTVSSMPSRRRGVLQTMARNNGEALTVRKVSDSLKVAPHTAEGIMRDMDWLGLMTFYQPGNGKEATLSIRPEWKWCMSLEWQTHLANAST